ncbi:MAG TPA: hypothetical protein VLB44_12205 [Kofleriaceae bacterium]|nr:hypothetical protein [Kofleriaceae bacterium]
MCELGSKVGLHDRAIELALRAARAAAAGACDDALANAREVRTLDATVYEVLAKHRALTECIAKESNPVAQGGPDATSSNPVALGGLDATSSDVVAAEMVVDETTSTDIADETDKTTAVDVARLARCARPIYLEPSVLFGIAGASAPTLLRLTGGARFARCGEYGIGRDVHVGLVFEAPAEFGWRTGAGLELRTSWAVDGNGRVHLGPRVSAVRMPGNRIALWFGARLETGPLSFGMDVVLPIDSLGQVGPTRAASTGVFAVVGLRDKPGTIATGVISLAIPVALLAFWSFLAVAL